jgi:hypothetical protein
LPIRLAEKHGTGGFNDALPAETAQRSDCSDQATSASGAGCAGTPARTGQKALGRAPKKLQPFSKFLTPYAAEVKDELSGSGKEILFAIASFFRHIHLKGCTQAAVLRARAPVRSFRRSNMATWSLVDRS